MSADGTKLAITATGSVADQFGNPEALAAAVPNVLEFFPPGRPDVLSEPTANRSLEPPGEYTISTPSGTAHRSLPLCLYPAQPLLVGTPRGRRELPLFNTRRLTPVRLRARGLAAR